MSDAYEPGQGAQVIQLVRVGDRVARAKRERESRSPEYQRLIDEALKRATS